MKKLDGKTAIITGAGQGLGFAFAKVLSKEGANITIAELNEETGQKAAEKINADGGNALFVQCDVSKEDHIKNAVNKTV